MLLLRTVREHRWYKEDARPFLEAGDVPADPIQDLNTQGHLLSVWQVADDRSNLERIVRAVAAGRGTLADMGWILFDSRRVIEAGIDVVPNIGESPDDGVNPLHRDLSLSGQKLVALTRIILETEIDGGNSGTILKHRMRELVQAGVDNRELPERCRKLLK
jgi:hypothetical protein